MEEKEKQQGTAAMYRTFLRGLFSGIVLTIAVIMAWNLGEKALLLFGQRQAGVLTSAHVENKLKQIQNLIASDYYFDVDPSLLETMMFKGIAAGLDDIYAAYYSKEEMQRVYKDNMGEYYGIGVLISQKAKTGDLVIEEVYEDSPAERAGLLAGDILISVNEISLAGMGLSDAIAAIQNQGDEVRLTVLRGQEEVTLQVVFDQIKEETVTYELIEDDIGMIRLKEFDQVTIPQFEDALIELSSQGMQKLIVDVRSNPGGLLESVTGILDNLLDQGLLMYTKQRNGKGFSIYAQNGTLFDGPVAVLVNGNSASAAEVFAGVLQDYEVGPIIGSVTYGKGTVQKTVTLKDGSAFKFTAEKYYTAKGQDINGVGVTPDIITENEEDDIKQAIEALKTWNRK